MKVALVGAQAYSNSLKVKDFIFFLKNEYGGDLTLLLGGRSDGFDAYNKKVAMAFGINFELFPPFHYKWNWHCPLPTYLYGKPYNPKHYFQINSHIVKASDVVVVFLKDGIETKVSKDIIHRAKKAGKKLIVSN